MTEIEGADPQAHTDDGDGNGGRGRTRSQRRSLLLAAAGLVALFGVGFGVSRALQPGSDRRAAPSPDSTGVAGSTSDGPGSRPAATTNAGGAATSTSGESGLAEAGLGDRDPVGESSLGDMVVPYREGFLFAVPSAADDPLSESTSVSFVFTTDGTTRDAAGPELEVSGTPIDVSVREKTLLVVTQDRTSSAGLHMYWSEDLQNWAHDDIDLTNVPQFAGLSPAAAELVSAWPLAISVATNGNDWIANLPLVFQPTDAVRDRFDVSIRDQAEFTTDGLVVYDDTGTERVISADELGVSEADLAVFESYGYVDGFATIAGRRGEISVQSIRGNVTRTDSILPFGGGFAAYDFSLRRLSSSADGVEFTPLDIDLEPNERIQTVASLERDLLVLASDGTRVHSYRVTPDGATAALGDVSVPSGSEIVPIASAEPIFRATSLAVASSADEIQEMQTTVTTDKYEVSLDLAPGSSAPTTDTQSAQSAPADVPPIVAEVPYVVHYVVRELTTGEVVAENTRPGGDWLEGEEIDGVSTVVFTDRGGRPDVLIPAAALDAADRQPPDSTGTPPESASTSSAPQRRPATWQAVEIATSDGIHWYSTDLSEVDSVNLVSINDNMLLVSKSDTPDFELEYDVIDIASADPTDN